ncbi:MAG: ATP-binding cassette domain-containing protein [Rikenellaceae bacterium]
MEKIHLHNAIPEVFAAIEPPKPSELWGSEVTFTKGERYLLQASSGDGKSSLCSYIYGYRNDYRGSIAFDTLDISLFREKRWVDIRKKHISILFQDLRLFDELPALENVMLKNAITRFKTRKEIISLFEALSIGDKLHSKVGKLSWGQKQRVAFIRALCQPFDFIILDEPISHLDADNSATLSSLLTSELQAQGAGAIVTTVGSDLKLDYCKTIRL